MIHRRINPFALVALTSVFCLTAAASAQHGEHGGWGGGGSRGGGYGGGGGARADRGPSESHGGTHYGTVHNADHSRAVGRVTFDHFPPGHEHYDPHGWQWDHHELFHDGYRWGYYHYDRWWRDDFFLFGFYCFDPVGPWVYSPWYCYPSLPPYIQQDRVIVVQSEPQDWAWHGDGWAPYRWEVPTGSGGDYTDLDYALQDLVSGWENRSLDSMSRLCPDNGRVAIYNDGHYAYSLNSADFFNTFRDGMDGSHTSQYKILDVKTNGHDVANVLAEQDYLDPWGKPVTVFHTYRLAQEGPKVVVRSFGTYKARPW